MRIAILVLLWSFSLSAWGDPAMCGDMRRQHADLLTPEQWKAVLNEQANGDPVLEQAIAVEHAKDRDLSTHPGDAIHISWPQARKIILLGAVRTAVQHHDLSVVLITGSGGKFTTREPRLDEIWNALATVDPCGVYILHLTE